jgi:hypothetical protein
VGALASDTDERLVERVLAGDDAAFEALFDRHVGDALWFAREALGSWGEAEEAVRHSFAAAHAYLASRDREVEFAPWLHTILGNHCLSMLQARGPQPDGEGSQPLAKVVDLDEWRRRRGRLGAVAVPVGLSAGLRDSVLAACGIGAGATAGGAAAVGGGSLLGGTLAKVAVVAVLAGGVGAAGGAVSERGDAGAGGEASAARDRAALVADGAAPAATAPGLGGVAFPVDSMRGRWVDRGSRGARSPDGAGRSWRSPAELERRRGGAAPGEPGAPAPRTDGPGVGGGPGPSQGPVAGLPSAGGPATPGGDATAKAGGGTTPSAVDRLGRAVADPVGTTLRRAGEVVSRQVAPPPAAAPAPVPDVPPVAVPGIGDDPRVTTGKLTADVRALLSPGSSTQPR